MSEACREKRYDRADTIGSDLPIFLETAPDSFVNATVSASVVPLPAELRAPIEREALGQAAAAVIAAGSSALKAVCLPILSSNGEHGWWDA